MKTTVAAAMHRFGRSAAILALWISVSAHAGLPSQAQALEALVQITTHAGMAGEIAIGDLDGNLSERAFGSAEHETGRLHGPSDRWLWASVTKQVTAVLVMQEVAHGHLSLKGTVADYLPEYAGATRSTLTVQHLLQHVSGLPNPDESPPGSDGVPSFYLQTGPIISDSARALGYCAGTSTGKPGAGFIYNNCDYLVLGAILQRVTGQSFEVLVAERLALPLGMQSVRLAADGEAHGGADALGYSSAKLRYPSINVATFGAAGALVGTARDLLKFDIALMSGRLLPDAARKTLWQGNPALGYEALGAWSFPARLRGCIDNVPLVERRGDVAGIEVRNVLAPTLGRAVTVFTNDASTEFGEIWQGRGLSYELVSTALCAQTVGTQR